MRPPGSPQELERRRRRAIALRQEGHSNPEVARMVGASRSSVSRWEKMARRGTSGLAAKPHPGGRCRLSNRDLRKLERLLKKGASRLGWSSDLWTKNRVAKLIELEFGVIYHPDHIHRLLAHKLGWSSQKPQTRARERDEAEIQRWLDEEFPRIKKLRA